MAMPIKTPPCVALFDCVFPCSGSPKVAQQQGVESMAMPILHLPLQVQEAMEILLGEHFPSCFQSACAHLTCLQSGMVSIGMLSETAKGIQDEPKMTVRRGVAFRTITRGCLWSPDGTQKGPLDHLGGSGRSPEQFKMRRQRAPGTIAMRHQFSQRHDSPDWRCSRCTYPNVHNVFTCGVLR